MNQILLTNFKKSKRIKKFKLILFISLSFSFILSLYYIYSYILSTKDENLSRFLLNGFNIERIYSEKTDYSVIALNQNKDFFVIGNIRIPSIGIDYPILSKTTDELLKIAPCKFYGPFPNKIGNLCIAAHNYDDDRFFGNLRKLNFGDEINIYDSSNSFISYHVYDKYEIIKNDTSCTSQDTNGIREITLITCNNFNGNRLIVKAKE